MTDPLGAKLGLPPMLPVLIDNDTQEIIETRPRTIEEEVQIAKDNVASARDLAKSAVQAMLDIATQSQHPTAYEVLNGLIKTYADISSTPVDLELKKQRLEKNIVREEEPKEGGTITNNLFVGSTADLLQILEDMKNKNG